MDEVLLGLLHRLEAVGDEHEEVFDSAVREALDDAVLRGFIEPQSGYTLPGEFAMVSARGNTRVREVLAWFLPAARSAAGRAGLDTVPKRLRAFQNLEVRTARHNDFNDFFGWSDPESFDESGTVIRRG